MNSEDVLRYLDVPFRFTERATPIAPQHRIVWGLSAVILILHYCCRSGRSSLQRLHVLYWALKSKQHQKDLLDALNGLLRPEIVLVRYDPALNRAVDYAIAENLIEALDKGRVQLTSAGNAMARQIVEARDTLVDEKRFLSTLGTIPTENLIRQLTKGSS